MTTTDTPTTPLASIDIGTNTLRLLVASPTFDGDAIGLTTLASRTATVRLGHGVERTGRIEQERLDRAVAVVEEFRQVAADHGATTIFVAGTSAVRDASNGPELRERIAATSGLTVEIIGGDREAALTFAGATLDQSLAGTLLVADLGGGSMELIAARDGTILSAVSLQLGSGRLTERHVSADPPTRDMIAAAEADARALLDPHASATPAVDRLIVVGGTAQSIPVLVPRANEARTLTPRRLEGAVAVLTGASVANLAAATGLDSERVRTLPAGVAIIRALLAAYGLDLAQISTGGMREGLILDHIRRTAAPTT
jgi:exopolyphosphatase / guanosine-5'-triphosphate,3'-diphosphate pyrophosphatase